MKSNSFAHGNSAYNGNSGSGAGPASRTITGVRLGGKEYASYPEPA